MFDELLLCVIANKSCMLSILCEWKSKAWGVSKSTCLKLYHVNMLICSRNMLIWACTLIVFLLLRANISWPMIRWFHITSSGRCEWTMLSKHICSVHSTLFANTVPEAIPYEALLVFVECFLTCRWLKCCDTVCFRGGASEPCDMHECTDLVHSTWLACSISETCVSLLSMRHASFLFIVSKMPMIKIMWRTVWYISW